MASPDGFGDKGWFEAWYEAFAPGATRYALALPGTDFQPELIEGTVRVFRRAFRFLRAPVNVHSPRYGWKLKQVPSLAEVSHCLLQALKASRANGIEISLLGEDSATLQLLRALSSTGEWMVASEEAERNPSIDVEGKWEDYYRGLSSKLKKNLNAQERKLRELGSFDFRKVGQDSDWNIWLQKALELEAAGWKGNEGSAILQRASESRFYRSVAAAAAERRQLRLFLLRLDERLIAFHFMVAEHDVLFWLKTGYDEALERYSPGSVLLRLTLKDCFDDPGVVAVNVPGGPDWTLRWVTRIERLMRVRLAPTRSWTGCLLRAEIAAKRWRRRWARSRAVADA